MWLPSLAPVERLSRGSGERALDGGGGAAVADGSCAVPSGSVIACSYPRCQCGIHHQPPDVESQLAPRAGVMSMGCERAILRERSESCLRCTVPQGRPEHRNGANSSSLAFVLGKAWVAPRLLGVDAVAFSAGQFADGHFVCLGSALDTAVTGCGQVVVPVRIGGCSSRTPIVHDRGSALRSRPARRRRRAAGSGPRRRCSRAGDRLTRCPGSA